jgi:hypothetical protein
MESMGNIEKTSLAAPFERGRWRFEGARLATIQASLPRPRRDAIRIMHKAHRGMTSRPVVSGPVVLHQSVSFSECAAVPIILLLLPYRMKYRDRNRPESLTASGGITL